MMEPLMVVQVARLPVVLRMAGLFLPIWPSCSIFHAATLIPGALLAILAGQVSSFSLPSHINTIALVEMARQLPGALPNTTTFTHCLSPSPTQALKLARACRAGWFSLQWCRCPRGR
jgi:hypothetical protein